MDLIDRIGKTGAAFRSLGDPLRDTSSAQGRLLSTRPAGIAGFERDPIRERTGDGRKRNGGRGEVQPQAQARDYQCTEAIRRRDAGETLANIAKSYGVAIGMISRL
jgi:DNA invertase Pin-like site-specific DNA recombinase